MAHFYGTIEGSRPTGHLGTKASGLVTYAAGWQGAIRVSIFHEEENGRDMFQVSLVPWQSSGGRSRVLAEGILDATLYTFPSGPAGMAPTDGGVDAEPRRMSTDKCATCGALMTVEVPAHAHTEDGQDATRIKREVTQ